MKFGNILVGITAAAGLLTAASAAVSAPGSANNPVTYSSILVYPDGKPAVDATLVVDTIDPTTNSVSALTYKPDQNGRVSFSINATPMQFGSPVVYVTSPDGCGFWFQPKFNFTSIVTLQPFTRVRVHLVDASGKPVPHVRLCPGNFQSACFWNEAIPGVWTQTTDSAGNATLAQLPQGCTLGLDSYVGKRRYRLFPHQEPCLQVSLHTARVFRTSGAVRPGAVMVIFLTRV